MLSAVTLHHWYQNHITTWEREQPAPGDPADVQAVLTSPVFELDTPANEIIASWGATTPTRTWIEVQIRARFGERWSKYYRIATWDHTLHGSRRSSFNAQEDADGQVATDTLILKTDADGVQARILLCHSDHARSLPTITALAICCCAIAVDDGRLPMLRPESTSALHTKTLRVPYFSQHQYARTTEWCSPTALAMALGYWYARTFDPRLETFTISSSVPALTAPLVYDPAYQGVGNWVFNAAYAAMLGLEAYVTRMHSIDQIARWIEADVPIIASLSWSPGELDGASIAESSGHMLVVTGVDGKRVHVADPAAPIVDEVARTYRVDQFTACWQGHSNGIVYVIYPPAWLIPTPGPQDGWS